MTPEEEFARANEVGHLLRNEYLKGALDEMETALLEQILACPITQNDLLKEMVNILRAKRKFVEILTSHVETGKMARLMIEQQERKSAMAKFMQGARKVWT